MNPLTLIDKYYSSKGKEILLKHSRQVAEKAKGIAQRLSASCIDVNFVEEAALLHDIGIFFTHAPDLDCHGDLPYLCHGVKGKELLERENLPRHALVCERHIGVGLTAHEIKCHNLPLPARDMVPLSVEEKIIAYADLFFSKTPDRLHREKNVEDVRASLGRFGEDKVHIFDQWHRSFGG